MFGFFSASSHLEIALKSVKQNPRNHHQTKAHAKIDHILEQHLSIQQTHRAKKTILVRTPSCTTCFETVQTSILKGLQRSCLLCQMWKWDEVDIEEIFRNDDYVVYSEDCMNMYERLVVFLQGTKQFSNETDSKRTKNANETDLKK